MEGNGLAEAVSKMAFGNKLGVKIEHNVDPRDFFAAAWGDIVCEVPDGMVGQLSISYTVIGEVTDRGAFEYGNVTISMEEALDAWMTPLEDVFPTAAGREARGEAAALEEKTLCGGRLYPDIPASGSYLGGRRRGGGSCIGALCKGTGTDTGNPGAGFGQDRIFILQPVQQ